MRLVPFFLATASFLVGLSTSTAALAADTWSDPFPGVRRLDRTTAAPMELHALVVNLCAAGVRMRATAPSEGSRITSSFGGLVGAEAAINGDFYGSGTPIGLAVGNGIHWSNTADTGAHNFIAFGPDKTEISFPPAVVSPAASWMREVVGGNVPLVVSGVPNTGDTGSFCTTRHPRTMVGLSADRGTLYLAVVDGRSTRSVGMRCDEMALFMKELGAHDALNLDGGGSTTMWLKGAGVVNRPSDGAERTVVNHLALYAKGSGEAWSCNRPPQGYLDRADCDGIGGWAKDPDGPAPIDVHLYVGGPAGDPAATSFSLRADQHRADLCMPLGSCNHGYAMRVPPLLQDGVARPVFAYGIDAAGGANTLLTGAPKTITCAARPPLAATDGVKRHVTSPAVLEAWRFAGSDIARVSDALLDTYRTGPTLPEAPVLAKAEGRPEVYVRDYGARRHIPNPTVLADWRFQATTIATLAPTEVDALLPGAPTPPFPYLVRGSGPEVYVIDAPPPLAAELVAYEAPSRVVRGAQARITIRLRNRGAMTWEKGVVAVAPVSPRDHESVLCEPSSWASCRRAASVETTTKPGDVGVFTFAIRAPGAPGVVRECWGLHAAAPSGATHWASDPGQGGPSETAVCGELTVDVDPPGDAGASDASLEDGVGVDDDTLTGSCGCRTAPRSHGSLAVVTVFSVLAVRRRRARRTPR